jgi:hypothetical protein
MKRGAHVLGVRHPFLQELLREMAPKHRGMKLTALENDKSACV